MLTACEGPGEKVRFEHSATEPGLGKGSENISRLDDAWAGFWSRNESQPSKEVKEIGEDSQQKDWSKQRKKEGDIGEFKSSVEIAGGRQGGWGEVWSGGPCMVSLQMSHSSAHPPWMSEVNCANREQNNWIQESAIHFIILSFYYGPIIENYSLIFIMLVF